MDFEQPTETLSTGVSSTGMSMRRFGFSFTIDRAVAQRFNAYAQAAWPREIGGLLKIEEIDGGFVATDIKIFPHVSANGAYFELDGVEVAKFNMALHRAGKTAEIGLWRSLIHSHPNMQPFLSGTDERNVVNLAGPGLAFSVICAARTDPNHNYFALHVAHGGPMSFVMCDLPIKPAAAGTLSGTDLLSEDEIEAVREEVDECFADILGWQPKARCNQPPPPPPPPTRAQRIRARLRRMLAPRTNTVS